ncbi:UDP-N-acetylmuramoyl-tripeptide--D-alanyl-D-alanine ligase [Streptomyces sp. NBC_01190]|uniref:UDP-N-acetylmuramoyl-tripeptide--D-alanyl-D- alanine ligase n=1 Tax=Streptomyces sp. NBC_01190 TaxID=2903767 RepID=UPI003865A01E|nr:UDP-N-acetylmuramoyl-tripeptide--D-alanyl-D-alanine ligase [Streptomyces sp. NBC_01190]
MIEMTLREVAEVTGGTLLQVGHPGAVVSGAVVIDSRDAGAGDLFVCIPGERVDGHDFAAAAVRAGAVAVLAQRAVDAPAVLVEDSVKALGALSKEVLTRAARATVVGLTGSAGKTSTKDLLAQVLERFGRTIAPVGSFNNEIGLPLTALRTTAETDFLVLEMGARGRGHIAYLAGLTPPKVGLVLNIGTAHLGEFGGREQTAVAKGELVEALPAAADGGLAVLNADDPLVLPMAGRTAARVLTFGTGPGADVRAEDVRDEGGRASFTLVAGDRRERVTLGLVGSHHVSNALAAAAVAHGLGLDPADIAAALTGAVRRSPGRMEILERPDGITVVNDAYNANPDSVGAALSAVDALAGGRRKVLVLGEMAELGEKSAAEHEAVGGAAVRHGFALIAGLGGGAEVLAVLDGARQAARETGLTPELAVVQDIPEALALLHGRLHRGDVVLVKASNSVGLQDLARRLATEAR